MAIFKAEYNNEETVDFVIEHACLMSHAELWETALHKALTETIPEKGLDLIELTLIAY